MSLARRSFLGGLLAAPAIIRTTGLLMPVKPTLITKPYIYQVYVDSVNHFYGPSGGARISSASLLEIDQALREGFDKYKVNFTCFLGLLPETPEKTLG